jgi:membrane-associated HD superfamily phosphohydrolase
LEEARRNLRISEATEKRIASELEQLKKSGTASSETIKNYEIYHESVQEMVAENRKIVEQMEAAKARHSSGADSSDEAAGGKPDDMLDPQIPEEQTGDEVAALDRQLNASLNEFDAKLLKEMDEIRDESAGKMRDLAQEAAEAAKRLREKGVDLNTSGSESSEASEETETQAEQGIEGSKTASTETSRPGGEGSSREEKGRASYEDDDIVARQLREAAENETDPELKEKLWKEYDEYKKNKR